MIKYCPICSEDNLSHARFCSNCGAVIAHIEPSVSGFGTARTKHVSVAQDHAPAPVGEPGPNDLLAGRMVSLAQVPQSLAKALSSGAGARKRWRPKKSLTGPYAVACMAGMTILALTASLAWIMQGQHPFAVSGATASQMAPAPTANPRPMKEPTPANIANTPGGQSSPESPNLPAASASPAAPFVSSAPSLSRAPAQSIAPLVVPFGKPPLIRQSESQGIAKAAKPQKPKPVEQAQKQVKQRAAQVASPSLQSQSYPQSQAVSSDNAKRASTGSFRSEIANSPSAADAQPGDSKANQVAMLQTKPAEARPKEGKVSVEMLCSDRSNFLSRGFCQNQYCTDPLRKNDQTCQKLRQYELARQNLSY
jgi:hypothetical protein